MTVAELVAELSKFPADAVVVGEEDAYGSLHEFTEAEIVRVKPRDASWAPTDSNDPVNRLAVWLRPQL